MIQMLPGKEGGDGDGEWGYGERCELVELRFCDTYLHYPKVFKVASKFLICKEREDEGQIAFEPNGREKIQPLPKHSPVVSQLRPPINTFASCRFILKICPEKSRREHMLTESYYYWRCRIPVCTTVSCTR